MFNLPRSACMVGAGVLLFVTSARPQAYTLSAKPGAVNFIEGAAYLDGNPLSGKSVRAIFLATNSTLGTDLGKAEVLLSPGVFLRIGDNSLIRMISPSLVNPQVEVSRGEAIVEVNGLVKDNTVQIISHGGSITIRKDGLYRIVADNPPTFDVLAGKAAVAFGEQQVSLGKGREAVLTDALKAGKFDTKQPDDLYAWSNVRSQYDAAASYQAARSVSSGNPAFWGASGFDNFSGRSFGPGWYWANGFNSYAWLPGNGAFYNPFGYGFYSPGAVAYAPVVNMPVYGGGLAVNRGHWSGRSPTAAVPVNPNNPPAIGLVSASPAANNAARAQAAQAFAGSGFRTASGGPVGNFSGGRMHGVSQDGHVGVAAGSGFAGGGPSAERSSGTGWSGGSAGGNNRGGASPGGGRAAGGGFAGGGHASAGAAGRAGR